VAELIYDGEPVVWESSTTTWGAELLPDTQVSFSGTSKIDFGLSNTMRQAVTITPAFDQVFTFRQARVEYTYTTALKDQILVGPARR
jgi:hypothetical protein